MGGSEGGKVSFPPSLTTDGAVHVGIGLPANQVGYPVDQGHTLNGLCVELGSTEHRVRTARRDVAAQINTALLDLRFVLVDQRHQVVGGDADETEEGLLHPVKCVVVPAKNDLSIVLVGLHEQTR